MFKNKFAKSIKDREIYKRNFQKTQEQTCLTGNTNILGRQLNSSLEKPTEKLESKF